MIIVWKKRKKERKDNEDCRCISHSIVSVLSTPGYALIFGKP
jgi:hypothetical protein